MTDGRHPVVPSPMRRAIARRMADSKRTAPHFYASTDIEMDGSLDVLDALNAGRGRDTRITVTAQLVRALAETLAHHPAFNATWNDDVVELVDAVNIGVAVALDDGLIAPAVMDCADKTVEEISVSLRDLVDRTKTGRLRGPEMTDATFTLSNLGTFDISAFTAIVAPPQVAILATARIEARAVVRKGSIVSRRMMTATLSADHRAVDGAAAAAFLGDLKAGIQSSGES